MGQPAGRMDRIVATGSQDLGGRFPRSGFRRLGSFGLVLVVSGSGMYEDDHGIRAEVSAGTVLVLTPSRAHAYGPRDGESWGERWLVFDGPTADEWQRRGYLVPITPCVRHVDPFAMGSRFDQIHEARQRTGVDAALRAPALLQLLLADLLAQVERGSCHPLEGERWLAAARAVMDRQPWAASIDEIASAMGLSYDTFRKRFRRLSGITPGQYQTRRTIEEAARLVRYTSMTSAQIADELGFYDEQHLSRRFRQLTGQSPRAYRAAATAPAIDLLVGPDPRGRHRTVQPPSIGRTTPVTNDDSSDAR